MGTPMACTYATLHSAYHKVHLLQRKYADSLLLLWHFIDDMILIWVGNSSQFNNFMVDLNSFGQL